MKLSEEEDKDALEAFELLDSIQGCAWLVQYWINRNIAFESFRRKQHRPTPSPNPETGSKDYRQLLAKLDALSNVKPVPKAE
jgi:hypothetical protein